MSTIAPAQTTLPAGAWTIDPAHSTLEFAVRHLGITTVKGRATSVQGTITGGAEAHIEGVVDAASLTTHDDSRDEHLRSPEFFDVERYPELRFVSTRIEREGDTLVVDGALTIRGVTRPVRLTGPFVGSAADPWGSERIGLELSGTIDRTEFGLRWNAPLPGGGLLLADDVLLTAGFSAVQAG